jgi:hypothetical protein
MSIAREPRAYAVTAGLAPKPADECADLCSHGLSDTARHDSPVGLSNTRVRSRAGSCSVRGAARPQHKGCGGERNAGRSPWSAFLRRPQLRAEEFWSPLRPLCQPSDGHGEQGSRQGQQEALSLSDCIREPEQATLRGSVSGTGPPRSQKPLREFRVAGTPPPSR